MNELDMAKRTWKFFLTAHPEADADGVVETIVSATQEMTLKAVGEWLDKVCGQYFSISPETIETLKRGEMP
jgi:hypothetical protein